MISCADGESQQNIAVGEVIGMNQKRVRATARSRAAEGVYNLFRNKARPEIMCAVPEDRCVPGFITDHDWEYNRKLNAPSDLPPGFNERGARSGVRYNGFYLFQLTDGEAGPGAEQRADTAQGEKSRQHADTGPRSMAKRPGRLAQAPNARIGRLAMFQEQPLRGRH
jgi:hypothetical protein